MERETNYEKIITDIKTVIFTYDTIINDCLMLREASNYENNLPVNNRHKDTVFRMLFSNKKELLTLYNAVNGTNYDNPDELKITTLENAIYMTVKNDLSCVIDMRLNLFEHQSSVNPNMPLRDLDYVSRSFRRFYDKQDIYSKKLIRLPNPKFVVFYNGVRKQPERRELRLSDAYTHQEETPSLELVVLQLNINPGYNDELMQKCPTLKEYMLFVERVRTYRQDMDIDDAVNRAVNECINENIIADFLRKNKREVIAMGIDEYDAELHEKTLIEIGREQGIGIGHKQGIMETITTTVSLLKENGFSDNQIKEALVSKFKLSPEHAKTYISAG